MGDRVYAITKTYCSEYLRQRSRNSENESENAIVYGFEISSIKVHSGTRYPGFSVLSPVSEYYFKIVNGKPVRAEKSDNSATRVSSPFSQDEAALFISLHENIDVIGRRETGNYSIFNAKVVTRSGFISIHPIGTEVRRLSLVASDLACHVSEDNTPSGVDSQKLLSIIRDIRVRKRSACKKSSSKRSETPRTTVLHTTSIPVREVK